jgi:hypothetical protein
MDLPPTWSLSTARSAGLTRAMLRGPRFVRLAHDLVVQLDDAVDEDERLALLSRLLPPDAAHSHATGAVLLGAPIDRPAVSDLPTPPAQLPVCDAWGREVAHADLGYEKCRIALEYEGLQHADRDQFGRDIDRYSLMAADGWLVLRFAARHVRGPQVVVQRTRRTLLTRGWRPDARARGQRERTSFRAARTRATRSGAALGPMSPIRHTDAAKAPAPAPISRS